jgi:hypothetical protein
MDGGRAHRIPAEIWDRGKLSRVRSRLVRSLTRVRLSPRMATAALLGRACCHSLSAIGSGSILALCHHAASPPCRCSSRWWARHSGTVNSSPDLASERASLRNLQMMRVRGDRVCRRGRAGCRELHAIPVAQAKQWAAAGVSVRCQSGRRRLRLPLG